MTTTTHRQIAVSKFPTSTVALLKFVQAFIAALTNNPYFPDAAPLIAALTALFNRLDAAETAAQTRAKGTAAARNEAKAAMETALHGGKAYVQQKADATPEHAQAIIESATFATRKPPVRVKLAFTAKQGAVSGTVRLETRVTARRASYEWQWSADGGKTWTTLSSTLQAKTTVLALPVGTNCAFRGRTVTRTGEGDWSQVTMLLVK